MRFHKHKWSYMGQGYLEWVPNLNDEQWVTVYKCIHCDNMKCDVRDLLRDRH